MYVLLLPLHDSQFASLRDLCVSPQIGDLVCRFPYVSVPAETTDDMSVEDILLADDRDLNRKYSLKNVTQP